MLFTSRLTSYGTCNFAGPANGDRMDTQIADLPEAEVRVAPTAARTSLAPFPRSCGLSQFVWDAPAQPREILKGNIMPLYQCYSPPGLLTNSAKATIAGEITTIHTNATGAPELFVNVLFHEIPEGDCFVAGKPASNSYLVGAIRHGRDLETRQAMLREFSKMWTRVTGQSEAELLVALNEADPANRMEAGLILPEPGHEQEWFDENRARLAELGVTA